MRSTLKVLCASAAFACAVACGGTGSPTTTVQCSVVPVFLVAATPAQGQVLQTFALLDPGAAGAIVMNDTTFHVDSGDTNVLLCSGFNCTPTANSINVKTDSNGVAKYTVAWNAGAAIPGFLTETFAGSTTTCLINYAP